SEAEDYIQNVTIGASPTPPFNTVTQFQNVGNLRTAGLELELNAQLEWLTSRVAYTYIERDLVHGSSRLYGTPRNQLDADVQADLPAGFFAQASVSYRDSKLTSDQGSGNPVTDYSTVGLKAGWKPIENISLEFAAQNVFDKLYEYDLGYPGSGRSYSFTIRANY
ncbi:MAG TPA: TonB-dependent receptor, partial [Terriglobales bacterium]|nr:TonB-dependent receptor [Terriglobales bacterium]